ncbi:YdeI/OmpD-associated family protein [Dactylosporangium sp. CS-033363]|uniref:YdeI/OmpD-associated family protein n=1 Tax=Dactylosporangium sp. CS-033363 TaxID=3239935 RepID=UPI003D94E33D
MTARTMDAPTFDAWLSETTEREVWLVLARKGQPGLTATEALDVALCHGWIDSHRRRHDDRHFLQRYSPRRPASPWSQVNVERAEHLEAAGRMRTGGDAELATARADGRWSAAYPRQSNAEVPPVLTEALAADPRAAATFAGMSRSGRYALILPLLKARTDRTRATALTRVLKSLA